jgi:hypothetical protein
MKVVRYLKDCRHHNCFINVFHLEVKVKVKFTLEQATKAQKGSRGIALLFL